MLLRKTVSVVLPTVVLLALWVGTFAGESRADSTSFRFAVVGDSRGTSPDKSVNSIALRQLISDMNTFHPAFCLFLGDLVFGGENVDNAAFKKQLQEWIAATSHFTGTLYVVPGNHDVKHVAGRDEIWREIFPNMPANGPSGVQSKCSYYLDYGNSRFISIVSDWEDGRRAVDQKWLDGILASSTNFEHIFVMSHHPVQELGGIVGAFWESLVRHHVDVYFCGHWHEYNRFQPVGATTWQVIAGTAGAPIPPFVQKVPGTTIWGKYGFVIVDVTGASVKVTFYSDTDGDGHYKDSMDSLLISSPRDGADQKVRSNYIYSPPPSSP